MEALPSQPLILYSPTASLPRPCHPPNLSHMTAPGLRPFHTLHPCVKVPNLLGSGPMGRNSAMLKAESIGDVTRPKDGDAFNPIQWGVKKLDDLRTVA